MTLPDDIEQCELIATIGQCELCGKDPSRVRHDYKLVVHHIMRGPLRKKSTGKRFANLVLCKNCHDNVIHGNSRGYWAENRQLALLRRRRPEDLDLKAYNKMKGYGPDRITEEDLDKWADEETR